jgi:Domain of unknown function (DUF397)
VTELNWKRSSFCGGGGNNCVEIAAGDDARTAIRHSVHPTRGFAVHRAAFAAFIWAVRNKELDGTTA